MDEKACIKGKVSKGLSNEAAKKKCAEETNTLSPSIKDLKEVHVEEPMVKAWDFDPDSILKSTRKVTGTFHVPKVDKDREIITKAAMTDAIPDFMHLPILHDFHKERVLGLVTKVWEEADAFHFEALFKATHDVDDAWDKVSKGQYDHVSIYGSRLQGSASCGLDPSQRAVPCISNKIRLDSISACDDAARNDMSSLKLAKGFVIESEDGEITFSKAETSEGALIHGTQDGVKKKGGNMRVREVDEDDDRYKDEKEEKKVKKGADEEEEKASQNDPQQKQEQSKVVVKGDYDINGMFNRILDVLHKLVSSDKKVHSEMDKAEKPEKEPDKDKDDKRFHKSSELDWMKDKEDTQAKQRKEGVPQKERESFSQTNRFVNKSKPMEKCTSSCMKKGDNMAEEVKEEIVKAAPKEEPKVETDEDFVQNIVKANLETQTKSLQEFMKAQTDEIKKAVEKLTAMEDRIKKIEEQPIQKAAVVISEQLKPMEGYGSLNYKAIQRG